MCRTRLWPRCKKRNFRRKRLLSNASSLLWQEVQLLMRKGWSPEQIAGNWKIMHRDNPDQRVSHETIYAHIYAYRAASYGTDLIALLA